MTFYFTFGFSHPLANQYVVIEAADWEAARLEMFGRYGRNWGFQYDHDGWHKDGVSQAEKYGLTVVA